MMIHMRKAQKKQVREFIMLLAEAQQEIKTAIENQNIALALDLLEQCQQGAIQVGTLIDTLEGEGFITVTLLEQYCELVYQLHEDVVQWEETKTDITTLTERIETG